VTEVEAVTILPQTTAVVRLRVTDPALVERGCWATVYFDSDVPVSATTPRGATIRYQIRSAVKVTAFSVTAREELTLGPLRAVSAVALRAGPDTASAPVRAAVRLVVENVGEQQVQPVVRIEVRHATSGVAVTEPVVPTLVPMLPGAFLEHDVPLPALRAGRYVIVALLEWGGSDVVVRRLPLTVRDP